MHVVDAPLSLEPASDNICAGRSMFGEAIVHGVSRALLRLAFADQSISAYSCALRVACTSCRYGHCHDVLCQLTAASGDSLSKEGAQCF